MPDEELRLFTALFALSQDCLADFDASIINAVQMPSRTDKPRADLPTADLESLQHLEQALARLNGKTLDVARQLTRAASLYRIALAIRPTLPTLAVFLLSVAIECISNVIESGRGTCDKFVSFLKKYCPDRGGLASLDDFDEFLREIYYRHRSGFTHGGKDVPQAAHLADELGRSYVRNVLDGKEIRTPGIAWFARVVRAGLLNFLHSDAGNGDTTIDALKDISLEGGAISMKAKRAIAAHTIVTAEDVELD